MTTGSHSTRLSAANLGLSMTLKDGDIKERAKAKAMPKKSIQELQSDFLKSQKSNNISSDVKCGSSYGKKMM